MVEPRASILLVYVVADQSGSIGRTIDDLNAGLVSLHDAVRESSAAANVRLSVIGFSDTAFTYLEPADLSVLDAMPVLTAQSRSSYAAAFDQLAHRITVDIPVLEAQGYTVGQSVVFFFTGSRPNRDQDWRSVRADLLDEPAAPAILAFGIGDADAAVISEVATKPHYAFVSIPGVDTGAAMSELVTALTQSVVSSGQATASGSTGLHFDKPEAFTFAADAPITNPPPPPTNTPPIPRPPGPAALELSSIAAASRPQSRNSRTTTNALIAGAAALLVVIAGVVFEKHRHWTAGSASPTSSKTSYGAPIVLPFTDLKDPEGVAVDFAGNVYVADDGDRIVKLPAGSTSQEVVPFTGLQFVTGVAVSPALNVYASENIRDGRVLILAAGSTEVLPFTGLVGAISLAVDAVGTVYVSDEGNNRVLKLRPGADSPEVLPFADLHGPCGVAVDSAGTVYVVDGARALKLAAGSATQEVLPFTGLISATGVAVDTSGTVYVSDTDFGRLLKLAAGSTNQEVLPNILTAGIAGVAVDRAGNLYVITRDRVVVKLPVQ